MVEQASTYTNIDKARKHLFVRWKDSPYKGGFVQAHFKGSISRLMCVGHR